MSFIEKLKDLFHLRNNKSSEDNVDKIVEDDEELEHLKKKYKALRRNCIGVQIGGKMHDENITHFGGVPLAPKDFEWPYFESDSLIDSSGDVKPRPLAFLAQFDCREFAEYDKDNLLPHTGVLTFFYSIESNRWGFDPTDEGCSRVYWFENTDELTPINYPEDLAVDYRFPKLKIKLSAQDSYPDYEGLPQNYDSDEYEEFFEMLHTEETENISKFLGWADTIQSEMESECELVTNHIYSGNYSDIPKQVIEEAERAAAKKWQLLFQLDTVEDDDFELMFCDCGRLYFWIRKDDLANRRFDKVWLVLQCY